MKLVCFCTACALVVIAANARAQDSGVRPASASPPADLQVVSPGEVAATPEMWFYDQERQRYEDPKNAIRARAEQKVAQRQARISAMKWYGLSNSRPRAGIDVVHGVYSPQWVSNGYSPFQWPGPSGGTMFVTPR